MKLVACSKLRLIPENRVWYRAINPKHSATAIGSTHTKGVASRFSPGPNTLRPFEVLYFSENQHVALYEVEALLGSIHKGLAIPNPTQAWLAINVQVVLQKVADLTEATVEARLGTSAQELTGDWEGYDLRAHSGSIPRPAGTAPTQHLGEALFSTPQIEGFRTISARIPTRMNLVVFPEKLMKGSQIVYTDHTGQQFIVKSP